MELSQVKQLAEELMNKYGLIQQKWIFGFNNRKVGLGICRHHIRTIELATYYVQHNTDEDIKDTILHEICHALTKGHGHDWTWKLKCRELGCTPRCASKDAVMPEGRYKGVCPCCGKVYWKYRAKGGFQRLVSRGSWCLHCGKDRGRINWTDMEKNLTLYYVPPKNPNIITLQNILDSTYEPNFINVRTHDTVPAMSHDTPPVYSQVLDLVQVSSTEAVQLAKTREMVKV